MADQRPKRENRATPPKPRNPPTPPAHLFRGRRMLRPLLRLIDRLHDVGTERDRAGNRKLFYDHYVVILLMYFFNPSLQSLRALQQATEWEKTRKKLGIEYASLGSLSEAARVFDADLLRPIVQELAAQAVPLSTGREAEALKGLTAVDGSIFAALPRMAWALWQDADHRGVKLHLHFDVLKGVPADATLTPAACSEGAALAGAIQSGRLYVLDRGYADYELFAQIVEADSSLVARVKDNTAFVVQEERTITDAAKTAGVIRDVVISRLGTSHHKDHLKRPMRLVIVQTVDRDGKTNELWLITDRLDLDADLVALAYRYRWSVELFFRWLKCVLGARHLIAHNENGVTLQMYAALIVSLLIVLRTGRKPTKRTFEMIQFYLLGWVSDKEFDAHMAALPAAKKAK
jgi:Transposase DDE domain